MLELTGEHFTANLKVWFGDVEAETMYRQVIMNQNLLYDSHPSRNNSLHASYRKILVFMANTNLLTFTL